MVSSEINSEISPFSAKEEATQSNPQPAPIRASEKTVRLVSLEINPDPVRMMRQTGGIGNEILVDWRDDEVTIVTGNRVQRKARKQGDDLLGKLSLPPSNKLSDPPKILPPIMPERESQGKPFQLRKQHACV